MSLRFQSSRRPGAPVTTPRRPEPVQSDLAGRFGRERVMPRLDEVVLR